MEQEAMSDGQVTITRNQLKDILGKIESAGKGSEEYNVGAKLGLRKQRQIIRQKLTEIYWGGVIPNLKDIALE